MTLTLLLVALRYAWALPNTVVGALLLPLAMGRSDGIQVVDGVIEAHGPLVAAVLRRCIPLPNGASAITFGNIVLASDSGALHMTRAHERVHVRQCELWGPAFIPAYLLASAWSFALRGGAYYDNWFERQARARAGER